MTRESIGRILSLATIGAAFLTALVLCL